MRDGKNINKSALSHEKVLISGYGDGSLRAYLPLALSVFVRYMRRPAEWAAKTLLT
jgi:hypothetical protein